MKKKVSYPVMTFECPRCHVTADVHVSPQGKVQQSSRAAGLIYSIDYENPTKSTVYHHCHSLPEGEPNPQMKKISEREA